MRRVGLLLLLLSGCHLGPRYEVPPSQVPETWKADTEQTGPQVECWWEAFQDDLLNKLEEQLLTQNFDLQVALERVETARAVAGATKSQLYPQASLRPSYNDTGELIELYGVPPGLFPALKTIVRAHEMTYELPLNMSYEVDIWQKYRGSYNAAEMNVQARQEALRSTWLTLTSELASNYYNLRTADVQNEILRNVVKISEEQLRLRQLRYLLGLDSYLDVLQVMQQYESNEAMYQESVQLRNGFENAIATLVGVPASSFRLEEGKLAGDPPLIPAGLPSTLLTRRPDIAQAERMMASKQALIGVAYSSFFPSLNLTGALGFLSPELSKFLTWAGHLWQWGTQIFQTVFDGWLRKSLLDGAKALFREALDSYQQTVLQAFQEVEDALNHVESEAKQAEELWVALQAAGENAGLFEKRFEVGVSNQLDVLGARLQALQREQTWVNMQGLRYQATIQLIKALGGSWGSSELSSEENASASQCEQGDESHRPDVIPDDLCGEVFDKTAAGDDQEIP